MFRTGLLLACAFCCQAADIALVKVETSLETGSQTGKKIPVTLAYDASSVLAKGDSMVPAAPVDDGLTPLQRAEAVFHDGVLTSVRLFLRMENAESPVHKLVIGLGSPDSLNYVDQHGGTGTGTFRVTPVPNSNALSVIRSLPEPLFLNRGFNPSANSGNPGLVILAPEPAGANPLNIIRAPAAPGLVVIDPAPLSLHVPPPPR